MNLRKIILQIVVILLFADVYCLAGVSYSGWQTLRKVQNIHTGMRLSYGDSPRNILILNNPAVAAGSDIKNLTLMGEFASFSGSYGGLIYSHPLLSGTLSGGMVYYNAGTVELYWLENGVLQYDEAIAQRDIIGLISYARRMKKIDLGITIKYAISELAELESASAYAFDIGLICPVSENMKLALSLGDMGTATAFIESNDPLPSNVSAQSEVTLLSGENGAISLDIGVGGRYYLTEGELIPDVSLVLGKSILSITGGYTFNMDRCRIYAGLNVLVEENWLFGYTIIPDAFDGQAHCMELSYSFDSSPKKYQPKTLIGKNYRKKPPLPVKVKEKKQPKASKKSTEPVKVKEKKRPKKQDTAKIMEKKKVYFYQGQSYFKNGDYEKSIKAFKKLLKLDPEHPQSIVYIKRAEEALKK